MPLSSSLTPIEPFKGTEANTATVLVVIFVGSAAFDFQDRCYVCCEFLNRSMDASDTTVLGLAACGLLCPSKAR